MNKFNMQRGFSLVELMVGMTLALIGILVISQVVVSTQKNKKDAVSSGDAQQNGAMALYDITTTIGSAGYGIASAMFSAQGVCENAAGTYLTVSGYKNGAGGGDFNFWLAPVVITNGAGGNSDSITVMQGNTSGSVSTINVAAATENTVTVAAGTAFNFNLGDTFLMYQSGKGCIIGQVTANDLTSNLTYASDAAYASPYTLKNESAVYNKAGGITSTDPALFKFTDGSKILNLGPTPTLTTYSVANGSLNSDASAVFVGNNEVVADGIVNMQAQYGVDTNGDGTVDSYVDAPTANPHITDLNADGKVNQADWLRVRAIRVAILARGIQPEKACNSKQPAWSGGNFDMSTAANWQCYRYRVFETVMPLRNVLWDPT
jgi:type IV pilus assembly protein PilW